MFLYGKGAPHFFFMLGGKEKVGGYPPSKGFFLELGMYVCVYVYRVADSVANQEIAILHRLGRPKRQMIVNTCSTLLLMMFFQLLAIRT